MKKLIPPFSLIVLLASILSCNNEPAAIKGDPPKEVLQAFFQKMTQTDLDGAAALATKDSKPVFDMMKQLMVMAEMRNPGITSTNGLSEKFKSVEIGEATINGNTALVPVKNIADSVEISFPLKVEDGVWKTEFSIATLSRIGMAEMGKRGMPADSIVGKMGRLKEMMGKQRHIIDSLKKTVDPEKLKEAQRAIEKSNN